MRKTIISILLVLIPVLANAQSISGQTLNYSVRYEKSHLFLRNDSNFNVVDYDIEWPTIIDNNKVRSLKHIISKSLCNIEVEDFDSLGEGIRETYGQPVTKKFKTIPDDNRFCYINYKANIIGYQPKHWVAYYLETKIEPQKLSKFKPINESRVVVYDVGRDRLYTARDLVHAYVTQRMEPQEFYDELFATLPDDFFNNMVSCEIEGVWTKGEDLYFLVKATSLGGTAVYTVSMPLREYRYALSREGSRVFIKKAKKREMLEVEYPKNTWNGDSIYNNVESMPKFKGRVDGLREYLSHVSNVNTTISHPSKVYVSFIVDKKGKVGNINIIRPVDPIVDRHAAGIIRNMPCFTPGKDKGKEVSVRMIMPINYRPQR